MKKYFYYLLIGLSFLLNGCQQPNKTQVMHFATSAEYPPFEYHEQGKIKGFDIDLAKLIAKQLGKKAVFDNMQFSSILPALNAGQVDAAISTITITAERQKNFDFSTPYYFEKMAAVTKQGRSITTPADLHGKKLACQLGTTMEIWLKKNVAEASVLTLDNNNQAIEALKAGHVDVVLVDGSQGAIFSQKNPGLTYSLIAQTKDGYGLVFKKNSSLTAQVNQALEQLKASGEITQLKKLWLKGVTWRH